MCQEQKCQEDVRNCGADRSNPKHPMKGHLVCASAQGMDQNRNGDKENDGELPFDGVCSVHVLVVGQSISRKRADQSPLAIVAADEAQEFPMPARAFHGRCGTVARGLLCRVAESRQPVVQ